MRKVQKIRGNVASSKNFDFSFTIIVYESFFGFSFSSVWKKSNALITKVDGKWSFLLVEWDLSLVEILNFTIRGE